jgi:AAA+ superfamily predicted ATPase
MKKIQINIEDHDLDYGILYSGNIKSWFPELRQERIDEYNNFINGFIAISKKLNNQNTSDNFAFINNLAAYTSSSLFANAENGLKSLFYFNLNTDSHSINDNIRLIASRLSDTFVRMLRNEKLDLENKIDSYYRSINSYTKSELEKSTDYKNIIEISYKNKKLSYPELENIIVDTPDSGRFSLFRTEEVAGNTEAKKTLVSSMDRLLCYDSSAHKNNLMELINFPKLITLIGPAGSGKTMLITQALDYLSKKCFEMNKSFVFLPIDADTKSEYRSISERQLKKKFDLAYRNDSISVILIEEIDTKILSRTNLDSKNAGEISFTGTFLECIEGMNKYLGNFAVLTTSNRQLDPDNALKRRLMENVIFVNGLETVDDHILVMKNKLGKGIDKGYIKINDWETIGKISKGYNFQGGDIKNFCLKINNNILNQLHFSSTRDYEKPEQLLLNRVIGDDKIIEAIHEYKNSSELFDKDFLRRF